MYNTKTYIKLMIISTKMISKHSAIRFKHNKAESPFFGGGGLFFCLFVHVKFYFTVVEVCQNGLNLLAPELFF